MLTAVLSGKTIDDIKQQLAKASAHAQAIEWRLDYLDNFDLDAINELRKQMILPVIFTLRKKEQGGHFSGDEQQRLDRIKHLLELSPDYFDIEYDVPTKKVKALQQDNTSTQFICSYHNFDHTPENLEEILADMQQDCFSFYKIATRANSTLDVLRMLHFLRQHRPQKLTCLCMGERGRASRILAAIYGNQFHYAAISDNESSAPGQLSLTELSEIYRIKHLNAQTKIYALLGDPVEQSIGHIFHNNAFKQTNTNAVYVKLTLQQQELADFFTLCQELNFSGFSVTMPLKEVIMPFLDEISNEATNIAAVNTININNNKLYGSNTDASGALDAIEAKLMVDNKKLLIIGAGGSAKAIAYEAKRRGAKVTVINRGKERVQQLAAKIQCHAYSFENFLQHKNTNFDVVINTIPMNANIIDENKTLFAACIKHANIVMDINDYDSNNFFAFLAKQHHQQFLPGQNMFNNQAQRQQTIWSK